MKRTDHLRTPEAAAARKATRAERFARPTTRPGSERSDLRPGAPVRIACTGVSLAYKGRRCWVAVVNTQRFPDGSQYTEIGVTWSLWKDWARAAADAWFRVDELTERAT